MSTQIDYARIVLLTRTGRELAAANPVLLAGEAGIADVGTVSPSLRFGDGVRPWTALPSFGPGGLGGGAGTLLSPVTIVPGAGVALTLHGSVNEDGFRILGAPNTINGRWLATLQTPNQWSFSNGLLVQAGTNAADAALTVRNAAGTNTFLNIRGNGTGWIGSSEANSMHWDALGQFTVSGTAMFPGGAISRLSDVRVFNLTNGQVLTWNGTQWVNAPQTYGTVTGITAGTGLTGGVITISGTIALANTAVTPGDYTNPELTIDAQGRVTHAVSGIEPTHTLAELTDVALTAPAANQVLTFNGATWQNGGPVAFDAAVWLAADPTTPLQAATKQYVDNRPAPPLASLAGVSLGTPAAGQALTFNGTNWTNDGALNVQGNFTVGAFPASFGGAVTLGSNPTAEMQAATKAYVDNAITLGVGGATLDGLTDINVTDAQAGEVLAWDGTHWVNAPPPAGELASLSDVTVSGATAGALLTWNGTRWVNGGPATITGTSTLTPLELHAAPGTTGLNIYTDNGPFIYMRETASNIALRLSFNANNAYIDSAGAPRGLLFATQGSGRVEIDNNGTMQIFPPNANSNSLTILGSAGSGWGAQLTAAGNGLNVNAGDNTTNTYNLLLRNSALNTLFGVIYGDGTGALNNLTWGKGQDGPMCWSMGVGIFPNTRLIVNSVIDGIGFRVLGANHTGTFGRQWLGLFTSAPGNQYTDGVYISAGFAWTDNLLRCANGNGGAVLEVRGDGSLYAPYLSGVSGGSYVRLSAGWLGPEISSRRFKTNIRGFPRARAREIVRRLELVSFNSLCQHDDPDAELVGLVAEDVAELDPALVTFGKDGKPASVAYERVALMMLPLVQEMLEREAA